MKISKLYILVAAALFTFTSCERPFDELEKDPNRPTSAPASLVLGGILNDVYGIYGSGAWNDSQRYNQYFASNYNYYATNEYTWTQTGFQLTPILPSVSLCGRLCLRT